MREELLKQLVCGVIANNWLTTKCKDETTLDLDEYYISAIKQVFNSGYDSGAFEDIDAESLSTVYNELTGLDLDDLFQENANGMALAFSQNRSLLGLD